MSNQSPTPLILIADDDIHTTIMLERIFERERYRVQSVHDGVAALDAAQRLRPDLILLDIQMPGMNGFDVLKTLRENPRTNDLPTILITAKARQPTDVAHGLNLGADDYIQKPVDARELVARVQSKIRAHELEVALQRRTQELEALLRVSEELNQHLETSDLLQLVPYLALDLLPGKTAAIFQTDEDGRIVSSHAQSKGDDWAFDEKAAAENLRQVQQPVRWSNDAAVIPGYASGMIVPLKHGEIVLGYLALLSHDDYYDQSHLRLFQGIGRQAALALRNAQLYEVQMNYSLHLEDMVAARTSELQSAQQLLIRAEKLASIGHLAASIAHEINNPLQPIRVHLDDMMEDIQNQAPVDVRAVQSIQESVERIRRIVSQLLEFAGRRGSASTELRELDASQIIEGVVALNRKFFEKENLRIETDLQPLPAIYGSKDQLEQVFMNMMLNAKAAMQPGGVLKVATWHENDSVVIVFADNGCGIPPEEINRIFDPFYSTKPSGTGLGLFVSYGIIQGHHGTIEVQSTVAEGSTFIIKLPIYTAKN